MKDQIYHYRVKLGAWLLKPLLIEFRDQARRAANTNRRVNELNEPYGIRAFSYQSGKRDAYGRILSLLERTKSK